MSRRAVVREHRAFPETFLGIACTDSDAHVVSARVGFLCRSGGKFFGLISCADEDKGFFAKRSMGMDLPYQDFLFDTRAVTGSPNPTVNVTYRTTNHAGGVTFRVQF